jgi:hypothetical protein
MNAISYPTATVRATARLERIALVLGVCLPVPLFAATGLALPMPSAVERLAAALVPWAEVVRLSDRPITRGVAGTIVLTRSEQGPLVALPAKPRLPGVGKEETGAAKAERGTGSAAARRSTPAVTPPVSPTRPTAVAEHRTPGVAAAATTEEPVAPVPHAAPRTEAAPAPPTSAVPSPKLTTPTVPPAPEPAATGKTTSPPVIPDPLPAAAAAVETIVQRGPPVVTPAATPVVTPDVTPIVVAVEGAVSKVPTPIGKPPKTGG